MIKAIRRDSTALLKDQGNLIQDPIEKATILNKQFQPVFSPIDTVQLPEMGDSTYSAARLIMRVRRREHITPILFALHWLPVRQRIQFKILTLVYRCQNHQAPDYLSACITPYVPGRSLRFADHGLLTEHRYRMERYGRRCFSVAGPALWNELPTPVKECPIVPVIQGQTKHSPLPRSLQRPCVVLVTFVHFLLFYLLCNV